MGRNMRYWQVAAGAAGRNYADDFLRYGIAFAGPDNTAMTEVAPGDRVVLRNGLTEILAAGTVVERDGRCKGQAGRDVDADKSWLQDYDGWDLSTYFYVDWHRPEQPIPTSGLTRGTIRQTHQETVRLVADDLVKSAPLVGPPAPEPVRVEALAESEMLEHLMRQGLRPSAAEELTSTLRRIQLLARYYYTSCNWDDVREHETRTFLIVPLLLALGWSEQRMKIELSVLGGRIDVACFARAYRQIGSDFSNEECVLILESKGFSQGLGFAHSQGKGYAKAFPSCRVVVASNGYCYKAYRRRSNEEFSDTPSAYLNLLRPTKRYPLDPTLVAGGLDLLTDLLP